MSQIYRQLIVETESTCITDPSYHYSAWGNPLVSHPSWTRTTTFTGVLHFTESSPWWHIAAEGATPSGVHIPQPTYSTSYASACHHRISTVTCMYSCLRVLILFVHNTLESLTRLVHWKGRASHEFRWCMTRRTPPFQYFNHVSACGVRMYNVRMRLETTLKRLYWH